jgi:hypothetical protein
MHVIFLWLAKFADDLSLLLAKICGVINQRSCQQKKLKKADLVLCYDDHVLLNNYVDHHLFTLRKKRLLPNEVR